MMCDCVAKVNERLAEKNTVLSEALVVSRSRPGSRMSLVIKTERLDPQVKGSKVITVMPSFCPFCGDKISRTLE
jgi:hypothetical protein